MTLDEALQTFIIEARELLEQMEDALLRVEQVPDDAETINAIFRAAHTINLEKAVSRQITGKLPPVEMEGQRLRARI